MVVTTSQLRAAMNVLCDHLEQAGYSQIQVPPRLYWSVPADEANDVHKKPEELEIHDLGDDWERATRVIDG
jgi:hypothetical protein